jgi:hypothetical protein
MSKDDRLIETEWRLSTLRQMKTLASASIDVRNTRKSREDIIEMLLSVDVDRAIKIVEDIQRIENGEKPIYR